MKDIMQKLAELEATAPKVTKKKMLKEDSTTPPMHVSNKTASLKDMFAALSESIPQGAKPLPVLDPQNKQAGMGFVTSNNPAVQNMLKNLDPKDVQIVQAPGQPGQASAAGQPAPAGATGQPQMGQMQMKEKKLDELSPELLGRAADKAHRQGMDLRGKAFDRGQKVKKDVGYGHEELDVDPSTPLGKATKARFNQYDKFMAAGLKAEKRDQEREDLSQATADLSPAMRRKLGLGEGAKVDRMVKHIEKSEEKLGKSKEKASDIAWATANKRGMLDNKNKKKVKEGDIAPTSSIDTRGAGLGAGRSATTLEGKKPDFLDLDKDGNKKEPMKKAAADKKKKKVDESMNHRISAARLEGKSHGLRGHAHSGKRYEDLDEIKAYHEGYKEGLDECYGQGVYETAPATPPATVGGMADAAMDEGNAFTAALAKTPRGDKFSVGGKTFTDTSSLEEGESGFQLFVPSTVGYGEKDPAKQNALASGERLIRQHVIANDIKIVYTTDPKYKYGRIYAANNPKGEEILQYALKNGYGKRIDGGLIDKAKRAFGLGEGDFAFESLDQQLNALLNESEEVSEGLSVSISKGQQNSPDSVTITAQDAEAEHLLAFVKNAGLGLFGDDNADTHSSAMSVQPSHGAPDEVGAGGIDIGVVDGHDGMMGLMQKLSGIQSGGAEDYADEEGDEEQLYGNHEEASKKDCGCDGDCECSDYDQPSNEATCNECGMMEAQCGCSGDKEMVDEVESEDQMEFEVAEDNAPDSGEAESTADENAEAKEDAALAGADSDDEEEMNESFASLLERLTKLAEGSGDEPKHSEHDKKDDKDQDDAEEVKEDDEDTGDEDGSSEDLTEWANQVGDGPGKGTDASFEQDIDFMTKVISGGLNKQKSTGQTTIPVIAGQEDRIHDESTNTPANFAKLAGIR